MKHPMAHQGNKIPFAHLLGTIATLYYTKGHCMLEPMIKVFVTTALSCLLFGGELVKGCGFFICIH